MMSAVVKSLLTRGTPLVSNWKPFEDMRSCAVKCTDADAKVVRVSITFSQTCSVALRPSFSRNRGRLGC